MIKINLAKKKKQTPTIAGVDFSQFNAKLILLSLIIYFFPEHIIEDEFTKEAEEIDHKRTEIQKQSKSLNKEIRKYDAIKEEKEEYERKSADLKKRFNEIENILAINTNPNNLLEHIARSLPDTFDIWFEELDIRENKIFIRGYATSYQSIGFFIEKVKKSPFFDENFSENSSKGKTEKKVLDGVPVNLQYFELEGPIVTYSL